MAVSAKKAKEINHNPRRDSPRLSSVTTAIHLLKEFSLLEPEIGITALAKRLGVAKSTVHRLASALLEEGLLQQNQVNDRYCLGVTLFSLGSLVRSRLDITSESKTILTDLRDKTRENVRLVVLERNNAVFLHDFESPQALRLRSETGQIKPAFCSAEGLCLLSGMREAELTEFFQIPRKARTANTDIEEQKIRNKILQVKRIGYAVEDEECDEGTRCLAAPIYNGEQKIVAAIGMAGPRLRIRKSDYSKFSPQIIQAASQISERLGGRAPLRLYV